LRPDYDGYYWCYEAAAVAMAFNIDDASFIDHEYYPSELMSWWKEGESAVHNLPLNEILPPEYENTLSTEERQKRNLANLTETGFKDALDDLQKYRSLFETLCDHLPMVLRQILWNALVDGIWDNDKDYGFVSALNSAI
jgi:hypothetical protein